MFTYRSAFRPAVKVVAVFVAAAAMAIGSATMARADESGGPLGHDNSDDIRVRGTLTSSNLEIGPCNEGVADVSVSIDGAGVLSALGRTTFHVDATATCAGPGFLGAITDFRGVYTAANGDELRFVGHGSEITFDFVNFVGTFDTSDQFAGGTGRFSGAGGNQHIGVTHSFATDVLTLVVSAVVELPNHHSDH